MLSWLCLSWRKRLLHARLFGSKRVRRSRWHGAAAPIVELLEGRVVPSVNLNLLEFHDPSHIPPGLKPSKLGILPQSNGFPFPVGYIPSDLRAAYGLDNVKFGSIVGDGSGQTIAIVDAYDDPAFVNSTSANFSKSDLAQFDVQVGLPDPPSFTKVNQQGLSSPLPKTDPSGPGNLNGNWEIEEALDIEYAHGMAPGANIVFVEATTDSNDDLFAAVVKAASLPGVSAVSMSWGLNEFSTQSTLDETFVTPAGHQGVTFLAASGDAGGFSYDDKGNPTKTPGILYPAAAPNVVSVGGTSLVINDDETVAGETAWSGSGGGTSLFVSEPAYQAGSQTTGFRTIPDVAFDADPSTGVAVYDSYNNIDNSGPWVEIGGTSLGAPAWAGLIAVANQGRVLAGASSLIGSSQTLAALYAIPTTDFNDITSGDNGVFHATLGYDEVTGLGSPNAPNLMADLSTFGTANHMGVSSQPPSNLIVGDRFGIVVEAENPKGGLDPAFNGTITISLDTNHPGAILGGTLTADAANGFAVFDGLTLNQIGSGFTIQVTNSKFPSITTMAFNTIPDPTPWQGTFYPVSTDASLRTDIGLADSNGHALNTIILSASTYPLSNKSAGGIVIKNDSALPSKTLTIAGQGTTATIIGSVFNWRDRIFQIEGSGGQSLNVTLQNLTIQGGNAQNGGILGGTDALGGALLIDDANVTLTDDVLQNNKAQGAAGAAGKAGAIGAAGARGGDGKNARGGGIYLASGTLSLFNDTFSANAARGGAGGAGGAGGGQGTKSVAAVIPGQGGSGGQGGLAAGGGIYAAGGTVLLDHDTFRTNLAVGGEGGTGGTGGSGGHGKHNPPTPGKPGGAGGAGGDGGASRGGAIYLAGGSLTLTGTALHNNASEGGAGGQGGAGGPGTQELSLTAIFGGNGTTFSFNFTAVGASGGSGGRGGAGGAASGGGVYVGGGSLTLVNATLDGNRALGGQGGQGGRGGTGGFGSGTTSFLGLPTGKVGGFGGTGGQAGPGLGGGVLVAGGNIVLFADTLNANLAKGGDGGAGGTGGFGPIAAAFGGSGITTGGGGTGSGSGGGGGIGFNTGGPGGDGGDGATGRGGGLYVSGGTLTLINATVAGDTANAGASGSGGPGGKAGTGTLTGGPGLDGNPGDAFGGGLYVGGGAIKIDNSTLALNTQAGAGFGGGVVVQSPGTVTAVSSLFAANGAVDYSGAISATDSLFQKAPINGTLSGSGNLVGSNPLLATNGLQNNGGPTQTIALQSQSPAIGKGLNPQNLLTDQRGYGPRSGPAGVDIGAYQSSAQADAQAPGATLQAPAVTAGNASTLNPYTFTITYSDNLAVAVWTLSNASVEIIPPGSAAPISATVQSITAVGATDGMGDAASFVVTYQLTPPGGSWTPDDNGVYSVSFEGGSVADFARNMLGTRTLGTFSVTLATPYFQLAAPASETAGQSYSYTVTARAPDGTLASSYTGTVHFTSSDAQAVLPADYTFAAGDGGVHTFSVMLKSAGNQTITATDATTGSITGVSGAISVVAPIAVQGVQINDGSIQRSAVTSITVSFSRAVGTVDDGAFQVIAQSGDNPTVVVSWNNSRTAATLTFTGSLIVAGSLQDGRFSLLMDSSKIHDATGGLLDGNGDGLSGGARAADAFFRLFGDSDGDGDVDNLDLFRFRQAFGTTSTNAGYKAYFDFDGDGDVDNLDLFHFRQGVGTTLPP